MLVLPENVPNDFESALPGSLGQIEIPGAAKKHGEVVVFTPEQRRAVADALGRYLANYEAVWRAGEDYYLFPGSKMRMLDSSGRRWTRKVRAGVKPLSRDRARVAFKQLEAIAEVEHVEGRGWYGLRRIAADLAESATTDDRVKDRLGGWQDSETRKQIYQDRRTDELRAEAAKVRRELRLGAKARGQPGYAFPRSRRPTGRAHTRAAGPLGGENQRPNGSGNGSEEEITGTRSDLGDGNRFEFQNFQRAGDGTRTHDVQLGKEAEHQGLTRVGAKLRSEDVMSGSVVAKRGYFSMEGVRNGPANGQA